MDRPRGQKPGPAFSLAVDQEGEGRTFVRDGRVPGRECADQDQRVVSPDVIAEGRDVAGRERISHGSDVYVTGLSDFIGGENVVGQRRGDVLVHGTR